LINNNLLKIGVTNGIQELKDNEELVNDVNWDEISDLLKTRKARDCRKRWVNSLNPNLKKGKWTPAEDQQLLESFQKYSSSWQKIAVDIPGRTEDQCAKRYIEVLDPNTKDRLRAWSLDEDLSLVRKVKMYGTKWRTISLEMESRPSLTCRNRWRKIVTDVVRGKAHSDIKKEIDSIEGGLSKVEEISGNFQAKKVKKESDSSSEDRGVSEPPQKAHMPTLRQQQQQQQQQIRTKTNSEAPSQAQNSRQSSSRYSPYVQSLTSVNSPSYAGPLSDLNYESTSPKPTSMEMDWKYTLKDTSGLTLSNGNISSNELAKQLIENAKKYDLKISIHQHIHHHYGSTNAVNNSNHTNNKVHDNSHANNNNHNHNNNSNNNNNNNNNTKGDSPGGSSSNLSGNNNNIGNEDLTYRYAHFNYLPPMVQPQLHSSNLVSRDNGLNRLLNPSSHQSQQVSSHQQESHQSNHSTLKRRLSNNSNHNSRSSKHHRLDEANNNIYEELDDELDFWETMRSLSQFNTNNPIPGASTSIRKGVNHNSVNNSDNLKKGNENDYDSDEMDLYYGMEETTDHKVGFPGPILPFNPS
jgi:Myb-like DNA-binding protein BAS1